MIAWVAIALAADPSPLLDRAEYRFCNEPGVDRERALTWCDSLDDLPPDACPGLRATCAGAAAEDRGCNESTGSLGRLGEAPAPEPQAPSFPELGCDGLDLEWLGQLARWGMAGLVAVALLVVLRLLAPWFGRERSPAGAAKEIPAEDVDPGPDEVPDRPSDELLAAARAALGAGRAGEAVWLARGAALRRLAERGRISLHRSRTDREHVRSVRDDASLHDDLREVTGSAELVRWGGVGVDADVARRAIDAAGRLLAIAGGLLLAGSAWGADRYGPDGDAGLAALLERAGYEVVWRTEPLDALDETTDLLVLDLGWVLPSPEDETRLRTWVEEGGVVLVAGDASFVFPELGEWATRDGRPGPTGWLASTGVPAPRFPETRYEVWTGGEALIGEAGAGALVEVAVGAGVVVGLPDGRLLANGALIRPENRVFLAEIFQVGQAVGGWPVESPIRVELATRAFAGDPASGCMPAESLADGRLLALVLQVLLLWGLVAAMRATSLSVPRDPPPEDRIRFSDHGEALARRTARTGDRAWADAAFARLWLRRLGPAGIQSAATRAGHTAAQAKRLAERVEAIARDPQADPELVEALWRITR